jgi:predicted glycoside hydrolase/deacetylase ChbG (UPF0249 family)
MLIINADDWGANKRATDNSLACFRSGCITSVSAMVFMEDAERAAALALAGGPPSGLHLNLTTPFDAPDAPPSLKHRHREVTAYLRGSRYAPLLYNPILRGHFDYLYKAQFDEYVRLYHAAPRHIDGHHHMHLCMNMLLSGLFPRGIRVRRNFTFAPGEKGLCNRAYRSLIDRCLLRRHRCTDFFFSIAPLSPERLRRIVDLSRTADVELMVHPEKREEYDYLASGEFRALVATALR